MDQRYMNVAIPLFVWKEGERFVTFTPALDLSSCGGNEKEAIRNFGEAVELFFETAVSRHVLGDLLESLGWEPIRNSWAPPSQPFREHESYTVNVPILDS